MSSTSHQREIKDLAAAGLNPILSSKYGGSSTPGGAMAQIADTHTPAAASAQARAQQTMQLTQMASQVNLQRAQANKVTAETANVKKVGEQIQATTVNLGQTQKKIVADVASLKQMTTNNAVREKILEIEKRIKFLNPKNLLSVGGEKIIAELAPLLNEGGPDWKATIMRVISQFLGTTTEPDPRKKSAPISSKGELMKTGTSTTPALSPSRIRTGATGQKRTQISFPEMGRTKQAGKDACDINKIMHRYIKQGVIEHVNKNEGQYLENTGIDFREALELVANARDTFAELPSQVRAQFDNDPARFMDYVQNPANVELLKKGLAEPEPSTEPKPAETAETVEPAKVSP